MRAALALILLGAVPALAQSQAQHGHIVNPPAWVCNSISALTVARGSGYTPGTYSNIPLAGGGGSGATADITVGSDGAVADMRLDLYGQNYVVGDVLTAAIPGGSGFNGTVANTRPLPLLDPNGGEMTIHSDASHHVAWGPTPTNCLPPPPPSLR